MRFLVPLAAVLLCACATRRDPYAGEYSAEIATVSSPPRGSNRLVLKVAVRKGRVRLEFPAEVRASTGDGIIFDMRARKYWALHSDKRLAYEGTLGRGEERSVYVLPLANINPCALEGLETTRCEPLGATLLDGSRVMHWRVDHGGVVTLEYFVDAELGIVRRRVYPSGDREEVRNVRLEPQPAELFEVPAGYRIIPDREFPPRLQAQ